MDPFGQTLETFVHITAHLATDYRILESVVMQRIYQSEDFGQDV